MYQKTGDLEQASQVLQEWVALEPDDPMVYYYLGLNQSIPHPDLAVESLQQAKRLDPALTTSVHTLVVNLNQASAEEDPAYRLVLTGRGLGAVDAWDLAGEAFRQATVARPDYAEAWAFLGEARQHLEKPDARAALLDLQKALEINPSSVIAQALHAVYWQRQGNPDQALPSLNEAARLEPENPVWQIELGNALAAVGKLYPALEHFQAAVDLAPDDGYAWKALASYSIQFRVEVSSVGIPAARKSILFLPRDPEPLDLLGQALLSQGDVISAERFFQQAVEIDPKHSPSYLHLGMLYLQKGERDLANQALTRAVELDPEGPTGVQALRQLELYLP
jgi:tetratricopeptide (TPR) repeat protein